MVYGWMTHSFLNSTEHRQMKKERAAATKLWEAAPKREVQIMLCTCRSFRFAHDPSRHNELRSDYDWRTWEQR
jgi:hypothetical protein